MTLTLTIIHRKIVGIPVGIEKAEPEKRSLFRWLLLQCDEHLRTIFPNDTGKNAFAFVLEKRTNGNLAEAKGASARLKVCKIRGQQVAKTFQLADFYVDNTPDRFLYTENGTKKVENPEWDINERLARLVRISFARNQLRQWVEI